MLQTSEYFAFNNQIQQFFFQLLIKLSSNTPQRSQHSRENLQIALIELTFILLSRIKNRNTIDSSLIEEIQSKLPENIQNLFIIINTIIAWTDQAKQTLLPEAFLQKSNDILGKDLTLNQDNFKESYSYSNTVADQDLINFMNNDQTIDDSFTDFIENLPSETEPNSVFYKNYASLSNIPACYIQIRAQFIYLLNKFIEKSLSMVDFSLPLGQSYLTDQIRAVKPYLLYSTKFELFQESLENTESGDSDDEFVVNFDTVKASTDDQNGENTMFYQAYLQLNTNAHTLFRQPDEQLWSARYIGMHSADSGGPYRDSITRICADICSSRLPLFILCPNGRTNNGLNRDCWIPNVFPPNQTIPTKYKSQYRFIGQLLGMGMRRKHYLNLKFPGLLWKQLLNEPITIEDIEAIDILSFSIVNETEKNIEQIRSMNSDSTVASLLNIMDELRFTVVSSSSETFELIPGGTDIPITTDNFRHYCTCYRRYRLNEFNRQIDFIRQGFYSVIPSYYLNLFTAKELEEAVCGKDRVDVEILKRNTEYEGDYNQDSPVIIRFWTVLSEMFTEDQKKLFLIFVWGRSTLPTRDQDFQNKFVITTLEIDDGDIDKALPRM